MKAMSKSILSSRGKLGNLAMIMTVSTVLFGCENYTTSPICTIDDAVSIGDIPGLVGVYEYTNQDEEFNLHTETVEFVAGQKLVLSNDNRKTDDENDGLVCKVGERYYLQSADSYELGLYGFQRLDRSADGLYFHEVVFDKASLEADEIATKVFVLPESVKHVLGIRLSNFVESTIATMFEDERYGLAVSNEGVSPETIFAYGRTIPVGFYLERVGR